MRIIMSKQHLPNNQWLLFNVVFAHMLASSNAYIAVNDTKLSWFGADDYCLYHYQSHLATVSSSTDQQNAESYCSSSIGSTYCWIGYSDILTVNYEWIGGNVVNASYTNWATNNPDEFSFTGTCVRMSSTDGRWDDVETYNNNLPFLCNDADTATPPSNIGYIAVAASVYNWYQADYYCYTNYQSHLATIKSEAQNDEVANACRNISSGQCWIGLKYHINDFEWRNDGTQPQDYVNWHVDFESINYWDDTDCVVLGSYDTFGRYWMDKKCSNSGVDSFVCDPPGAASPPSSIGFIGVYSPTEVYTFYEADYYCMTTYRSHLATITTDEENYEASKICGNLTAGDHSCYIGLNSINQYYYYWVDGSSLNHANWKVPIDTYEDENHAAYIDYGTSPTYWSHKGVTNGEHTFICNPVNSSYIATTSLEYIAYNGGQFGVATPSFYAANDLCYLANQTNLATIKSSEQNMEAVKKCKNLGNVECWVGSTNIESNGYGSQSTWHWISDDTSLQNLIAYDDTKWYGGYPGSEGGIQLQNLIVNDQGAGAYWKTVGLSSTAVGGFVCDPAGSVVSASSHGYRGYIAADVYGGSAINFYDATDYCYSLIQSSLATIKYEDENHEAINVCRSLGFSYYCWIGLHNRDSLTVNDWRWMSDNSIDSYDNWYPGEPGTSYPNCAYINALQSKGRTWSERSCSNTRDAFVCNPPNSAVAPSSLEYHGHITSEIGTGSYNFLDADTFCETTHGTHLATIKSESQNHKVINICRTLGSVDCWIGVSNQEQYNDFRWLNDSQSVDYTYKNWFPGEPGYLSTANWCVYVHAGNTGYGRYWNIKSCTNTAAISGFVCDPQSTTYAPTYVTNNPTIIPTIITTTSEPINQLQNLQLQNLQLQNLQLQNLQLQNLQLQILQQQHQLQFNHQYIQLQLRHPLIQQHHFLQKHLQHQNLQLRQ
eukprot:225537_1